MSSNSLLAIERQLQAINTILADEDPDPVALTTAVASLTEILTAMPTGDGIAPDELLTIHERLNTLRETAVATAIAHRERIAQALSALDRAAIATRRYAPNQPRGGHFIDLKL